MRLIQLLPLVSTRHIDPCRPIMKRQPYCWFIAVLFCFFSVAVVAQIQTTPSGLKYEVLNMGDGQKPCLTNTVQIQQIVKLLDGKEIDNSYNRNGPDTFKLDQVTMALQEGIQCVDWDSSSVTNSEPLGPTVVIDFEGVAPEVDPWVLTGFATYNEDGYALTFPYNFGTAIYDSNHPTANVNGTDVYFFDPSFANTRIEREDGGPFDLLSIDASAQPQGHENIIFQSISLTGYKIPGGVSVVSASFSLSCQQ